MWVLFFLLRVFDICNSEEKKTLPNNIAHSGGTSEKLRHVVV